MDFCIRNFIICIGVLLMLGGCAKKQKVRLPLPKIAHTTYKSVEKGVKLTIGHMTPSEFESIYPKGLGKHTILDIKEIGTVQSVTDNRAAYILQGNVKNNSSEDIYIARNSVSLPVIPVRHAYHKGILEQIAASLLLIAGILVFPIGSVLTAPTGGVLCTNILGLILWLPLGIVSIIPGATLIPIEHLKHVDRKAFAYGVMLPDKPYKIEPQKEFNWLMLIPTNEYKSHFNITCTNERGLAVSVFDVVT